MKDRSAFGLAAVLIAAGITHFVAPTMYDDIVPSVLPLTPRFWTLFSGAVEIVIGLLVILPSTRAVGALLAAMLFVAVFPANVKMAIDWADRPPLEFAGALIRLPLQIPLIWWAIRVWRRYRSPQPESVPAG